jgi:hypothetical protein
VYADVFFGSRDFVMVQVVHTVVLSVVIFSEGDVEFVDTGLCTTSGVRNVIDNDHFSNKIYYKLVNPSGEVLASVITS